MRGKRQSKKPWFLRSWIWKVLVPLFLVCATVGLGTIGFQQFYRDNLCEKCKDKDICSVYSSKDCEECNQHFENSVWLATGLPLGENVVSLPFKPSKMNWWLRAGRISGCFVIIYAFLILARNAVLPVWKRGKVWCWSHRLTRRKYAVVCGLGWRGQELVLDLKKKYNVVVLDSSPNNPFVDDISGFHVCVFNEDATSVATLSKIHVHRACKIFVVAGTADSPDASADELNCRIANQIAGIVGVCGEKAMCHEEISSSLGKISEIKTKAGQTIEELADKNGTEASEIKNKADDACSGEESLACQKILKACKKCRRQKLRQKFPVLYVHIKSLKIRGYLQQELLDAKLLLRCFNTYETTARQLMMLHPIFLPESDEARHVHMVVVGDTAMARALIRQLLAMMHLKEGREVRLDIIVPDVKTAKEYWYNRFSCLDPGAWEKSEKLNAVASSLFRHVKFYPLPVDMGQLHDPGFVLNRYADYPSWQTRAFFCLDDGTRSRAVLNACRRPFMDTGGKKNIRFFLYYNYPEGELTQPNSTFKDGDIVQFGSFCELCSLDAIEDEKTRKMAMGVFAAYEKNYVDVVKRLIPRNCAREYADLAEWKPGVGFGREESLLSKKKARCLIQERWDYSEDWERNSNLQVADHVWVKLQDLGMDVRTFPETRDVAGEIVGKLADERLRKALEEAEHRRWCAERLLGGWRPMPDSVAGLGNAKTQWHFHKDLIPYKPLPPEEKDKDMVPVLGIPSLLKDSGYIQ